MGFNTAYIGDSQIVRKTVYVLKELRNAVAHNEAVFDTRFRKGKIHDQLKKCLSADTKILGIDFCSIVDYVILITYMLKNLKMSKSEINQFIDSFTYAIENLRDNIPINLYSKIIPTDTRNKIKKLEIYVTDQ